MAQMIRTGTSDKILALRQLLQSRGFDLRDFDLEEDAKSGIGQLLGLVGGILTIRRRSTGEIRVYASGAGSAWYATIITDLDRGYFRAATAPREFRRPAPASLATAWL